MKRRLDIIQSSTEPSKESLWMTGGTLRYWSTEGWDEINKSHNEIPTSGSEGQILKYGKNGLEWGNVAIPTKVSQLTNDSGFISKVPSATASAVGGVKKVTLSKLDTSADITAVVTAYNSLVDKLVASGIASV